MQNILVTYFRKEISVNVLKITIKFNVNFLSIVLKYTLYLAMSDFWKSRRLYYISLLQQECQFTNFCKILLSKSVCRRFSIMKVSLKIFFSDEVEGCWLKRDSGADVSLWILLNFRERLLSSSCTNCFFWHLRISLRRDILCKV